MSPRLTHLALAATAGLALGAGPALASEGPAGPTLPNPLLPFTIAPLVPPAAAPPAVAPRVLRAKLSPRHVRRGHRTRLRVRLATTGRLRVVLERTAHRRHTRVAARTVTVTRRTLSLRLRKLRPGRYRVTVVAIDALGHRSPAVHRALLVRH
jgi:hypothetical protein